MADPTPAETPKKSYIILQRPSADQLQDEVNKHINAEEATKKYVPYWPMMIIDWVFYQVMTLASLYVYKVSASQSGTIKVSEIWWTVNVSWCWWWD